MSENKLSHKNYSRKNAKDFNILTFLYQIYALRVLFIPFIAFPFYKFKVVRNKNVSFKKPYIVASNHISYFDPFIVTWAVSHPFAYMAKKELFEESRYVAKNISRLGAFPVNREKLEVSTIKSSKEAIKAGFNLCIFPQGGIRKNKKIEAINMGFIVIAKMTKTDILPLGISGVEEYNWNIFKKPRVNVVMGEPISYQLSEVEIIENWKKQVAAMTNYELVSE